MQPQTEDEVVKKQKIRKVSMSSHPRCACSMAQGVVERSRTDACEVHVGSLEVASVGGLRAWIIRRTFSSEISPLTVTGVAPGWGISFD